MHWLLLSRALHLYYKLFRYKILSSKIVSKSDLKKHAEEKREEKLQKAAEYIDVEKFDEGNPEHWMQLRETLMKSGVDDFNGYVNLFYDEAEL